MGKEAGARIGVWHKTHSPLFLPFHQSTCTHHESAHCLDTIHLSLQCTADTSLITLYWAENNPHPVPNFSSTRKCRNWEGFTEWLDLEYESFKNETKNLKNPLTDHWIFHSSWRWTCFGKNKPTSWWVFDSNSDSIMLQSSVEHNLRWLQIGSLSKFSRSQYLLFLIHYCTGELFCYKLAWCLGSCTLHETPNFFCTNFIWPLLLKWVTQQQPGPDSLDRYGWETHPWHLSTYRS